MGVWYSSPTPYKQLAEKQKQRLDELRDQAEAALCEHERKFGVTLEGEIIEEPKQLTDETA